ncbi:MAG: AI-2E family transporter [Actinomycetota bacterium]
MRVPLSLRRLRERVGPPQPAAEKPGETATTPASEAREASPPPTAAPAEQPSRPQPRALPTRDVVRIVLAVAAAAFGLYLIYAVRQVILLAGVAAFLAIALEPSVTFLQRFVKSRGVAVAVMTLLVVVFVAGFVASVVPPISRQVQNLADNLPQYRAELEDSSTPLGRLERRFHLTDRIERGIADATSLVADLGGIVGTITSVITNLLVVLVLGMYFLVNAPRMKEEGLRLVPRHRRRRTAHVMQKVFGKVGGWMEGNILISVIAGVTSFVALLIIGVPFAAALAMWVAITDLIPMVGALLGAVVCVVVAFFTGVGSGIATTIYFLIYQQLENYVISPRVMRRTVDVSPVAVILAALIGGKLLGPIGVVLAVPAAASIKVLAQELWLSDRQA